MHKKPKYFKFIENTKEEIWTLFKVYDKNNIILVGSSDIDVDYSFIIPKTDGKVRRTVKNKKADYETFRTYSGMCDNIEELTEEDVFLLFL